MRTPIISKFGMYHLEKDYTNVKPTQNQENQLSWKRKYTNHLSENIKIAKLLIYEIYEMKEENDMLFSPHLHQHKTRKMYRIVSSNPPCPFHWIMSGTKRLQSVIPYSFLHSARHYLQDVERIKHIFSLEVVQNNQIFSQNEVYVKNTDGILQPINQKASTK